jgi:hypothetical protein
MKYYKITVADGVLCRGSKEAVVELYHARDDILRTESFELPKLPVGELNTLLMNGEVGSVMLNKEVLWEPKR